MNENNNNKNIERDDFFFEGKIRNSAKETAQKAAVQRPRSTAPAAPRTVQQVSSQRAPMQRQQTQLQRPAQNGVQGARPTSTSPAQRAQAPRPAAGASGQCAPIRPTPVQGEKRDAVVPAMQRDLARKHNAASAPSTVQKPSPAVVPASEAKPVAGSSPAYAARRSVPAPAAEARGTKKVASPSSLLKKEKIIAKKEEKPKDNNGAPMAAGADMISSVVKGIVYMVVVLVVAIFISVLVIKVGNDVFAFVKSDEAIDITIPEDATTSDVANILSENGIIKYPGVFKMYASLKKEKGDYLAGDYTVSPSMSYDQLRGKFKKQIETGTVWITFPEGYTTDEIIDLLVENGIGTRERYVEVINKGEFDYWFVKELDEKGISEDRAYRLDGYLFPDSYEFYKASSEELIINRMLKRFEEVFVEDYKTKAQQLGYTVDEILIIASLVEKEAGRVSDFMYVSSAFHNRLKDKYNYPKLESDATIVYGIQTSTGKRPNTVTPEDLKIDNPYNTYLYAGLTPGPITNPSASAIRYALYPADTTYRYFVSANNGTTLFASSRPEHEQNIQTVKKMNEEQS